MDANIFVSGKKKLRIKKYPDTCGGGLRLQGEDKVCSLVEFHLRDILGPFIREEIRRVLFKTRLT